jgi:outer membrane protein assembly factor BamB
MNDDLSDLPEIHVFVPDAPPDAVPPAPPEPSGARWMGLPKWALWVAGILLVAGVGGLVSATSGDGHVEQAAPADPTATAAAPSTTTDEADEPFFTVRGSLSVFVDTADTGGAPETRISLLDGSRVTLRHPPGVTDPVGEVRLSAGIWPTGLRDCCRRDVYLSAGSFEDLFGDATPVVELRAGQPDMGAVFGGKVQVLAFSVGGWTVAIAGPPERPFTPAELGLYRDLLDFDLDANPPVVRASAPLVVGDAEVEIRLDADPPVVVNVMNMARRGCVDDGAAGAFFVSCVDGFQVFGSRDTDPGIESPDVSVDRRTPNGDSDPLGVGTIAGQIPFPDPVVAGATAIVAGGGASGVVMGVDPDGGGISWTRTIDTTAFVSPVVVDDTVFAAAYRGSLLALDAVTGERQWALLLADTQGIGPLAAVETLAPSGPMLVVPTSFDDDGDYAPPLVYGVDAASGEVTWIASLAVDVTIGSWAPALAGDTVVIAGQLAVDNRDAQVITYGITTSGAFAWTHVVEPVPTGDDLPLTASTSVVFVRNGRSAVDAVDAATGELLWRHEADLTVWKVEIDGDFVEIFSIDEESVRLDQRTGTPAA